MPLERLGKNFPPIIEISPVAALTKKFSSWGHIVFVTGNAGKLNEVREILAQGEAIDIESRDLDCEPLSSWQGAPPVSCLTCANEITYVVPEIQGTTQEIATEKCRRAAEIVSFSAPPRLF
jgi:inosine/xanthosine triphosphate pyrophosphatase family protein